MAGNASKKDFDIRQLLDHQFGRFPAGKESEHTTLGEMLKRGLKEAFTLEDGQYGFLALKQALFVMRLNEIITEDTYDLLRPLIARISRLPWEYYEDGTVKFVSSADCSPDMDACREENAERYDPLEVLKWVCEVLSNDQMIRDCLCMDGYEEMIASAEEIQLDEKTMFLCARMEDLKGDYCNWAGDMLYFLDKNGHLDLYMNDEKIHSGMQGSMVHFKDDFYFKIDRANSFLHINMKSGVQEMCQNIGLVGFREDGCLVYIDFLTQKVCYDDRQGNTQVLCDYDKRMRYRAGKCILISSASDLPSALYRLSYDGRKQEAIPEDYATLFWDYFLGHYSTRLNLPCSVRDAMLAYRFRQITAGRILTPGLVLDALNFVRKNKCWMFGPAFPLINSVKLLCKLGTDLDDDISKELYAIVQYNERINVKNVSQVTPVFYFTLYRLSKRDGFLEMLRDDPRELFANEVAASEKARKEFQNHQKDLLADPDPDFDFYPPGDEIGVFRVTGHSVHAVTIPISDGIVRNDEIIFDAGTEMLKSHPGSVTYSLIRKKYVILMAEPDTELMEVIRKVFRHPEREVEYRFANEQSFEPEMALPFM